MRSPFPRLNLLLLLSILITIPVSVCASEVLPYTKLQSISYSQPVTLSALLDEWQPPFNGGDKALTYNRAEIGMAGHNWQLGFITRFDYLMSFSDQTAKLYYLTQNHLPLETGKEYVLRINVHSQLSRGVRLGFLHQWSASLKTGAALSYLQSANLTDGGIEGKAQVTAAKDYNFQFDANYVYSRDVLFSRTVQGPRGKGYSLDINVDWKPANDIAAQLSVLDLLGKLFWDNAPYTIATASSDTKSYDVDGYVRYNPVISGFESYKNFTQKLPRKIFASLQYQWRPKTELLAELQDLDIARFVSAGVGWHIGANRLVSGLYNVTAQAFTLRYEQSRLRIEYSSDKLNIHHASYVGLDLAYHYTF